MKPGLTLRSATGGDAALVARHRFEPAADAALMAAYAAWLQPKMAAGQYFGWLAEAGGTVLAGAGAVLLDWGPTVHDSNPLRARLVNVYCEPPWRGQGIATALIQRVLQDVRTAGVGIVGLAATPGAVPLYRRLGFRERGGEMVLRA